MKLRDSLGDYKMSFIRHYFLKFWRYAGGRGVQLVILSVLASSLRGVGFLMLLPFLQIMGILDTGTPLPKFLQAFMEQWRASPIPLSLSAALTGYVVLVGGVATLLYREQVLQSRLSNGFIRTLRNGLFQQLIHAPWTYLARTRRAELLQNVQQDTNQVHFAVNELMLGISSAAICAAYLAVALQLSAPLTAVCVVIGLLIALVLLPIRQRIEKSAWRNRDARVDILRQLEERMSMIKLVKSFAKETEEALEFDRLTKSDQRSAVEGVTAHALIPLCYAILGAIALSAIVYIATVPLAVAPERVVILILVFSRLLPQIARLQSSLNRISGALPALKSVYAREQELLEYCEPPATSSPKPLSLEREIRFTNAGYTYPGKTEPALKDLNIGIAAKQITALAGPSGAGKSTLADLSLGLLQPEHGTICIDDTELGHDSLANWRHSTAYMPQEQLLLHDTIRANLSWAKPDATDEELWAVLEQAAAKEFVRQLPDQLDTVVGERGAQLSGGERQRLSLARALMRSPALLVLDEPTSALDDENEAIIHDALQQLKRNTTILLIAHRQSTLQIADRVIRLHQGSIVE